MILPDVSYSPNYSRPFLIIGKPPKAVGRELVDDRLYIWSLWFTWWLSTCCLSLVKCLLSLFNSLHTLHFEALVLPLFCGYFRRSYYSLWLACSLVFSLSRNTLEVLWLRKNLWAVHKLDDWSLWEVFFPLILRCSCQIPRWYSCGHFPCPVSQRPPAPHLSLWCSCLWLYFSLALEWALYFTALKQSKIPSALFYLTFRFTGIWAWPSCLDWISHCF